MERAKMYKEAMSRMKTLQEKFELNPKILQYLKDDKLYYSYRVAGFGCIDQVNYNEIYLKAVEDFEAKTGSYIYHVIENKSSRGVIWLTLLYVSQNESNWKMEKHEDDYIAAYVMDLTEQDSDFCGEYGDVFLTSDNGALLRRA